MIERVMQWIGLALLGACFVIALGNILMARLQPAVAGGDQVTIRFAHWQLEGGVRDALDAIAEEYMQLHPQVQVVQIAVPERIYTNWLVTQLVGGTPPDIIQVGIGATTERLARFFVPLTSLANEPNPYNEGTDLEGVELRNTLFDGMQGGYDTTLLEYYSVPISGYSVRMFYNLDLLERVTGERRIPATYRELLAVCEEVRRYNAEQGTSLVPIAGSKYNAPWLMPRLFGSQTQRLNFELNPPGDLGSDLLVRARDFREGRWSLDTPEIRSGVRLMRDVGKHMQPGFMQLLRDDAALLFVQGGALMICTGSWDASSIRQQAVFPVAAGPIPLPATNDPEYGAFTLGAQTEAGTDAGVAFGLTRDSEHPETVKDFLRFLVSKAMNQLWTDVTDWVPAVVGVRVSEEVEPFLPVVEGYRPGFVLSAPGWADLHRVVETNLHALFGPFGGEELFIEAIRAEYPGGMQQSIERLAHGHRASARRADTQFAALGWLAQAEPDDPARHERFELARQAMLGNDLREALFQRTLRAGRIPEQPKE